MAARIFNVLTIAGSDPGGGAGIQADLKTFSALGAYGMSAITALTAQNTLGVSAVHVVPSAFVAAQLDAVFGDIECAAVKIGMLANADIVRTVAQALRRYRPPHVVLDTVMVSKNGHALLAPEAVEALRLELLPLADLITPNLPEAAVLLDQPPATDETAMAMQAQALRDLGARNVLLKGGHLGGANSPDWLLTEQGSERFDAPRLPMRNTHGTGCTLSAALAALRPQHDGWPDTVRAAKQYVSQALGSSDALQVGHGIGPLHHFHAWWPRRTG